MSLPASTLSFTISRVYLAEISVSNIISVPLKIRSERTSRSRSKRSRFSSMATSVSFPEGMSIGSPSLTARTSPSSFMKVNETVRSLMSKKPSFRTVIGISAWMTPFS
ncbi:hypothetical protein DSECCO2_484520 [anaerobic digester metagenome]